MRMEECKYLVQYPNIFERILDYLKKVDIKINEKDKTLLLLTFFVNSYDNFEIG